MHHLAVYGCTIQVMKTLREDLPRLLNIEFRKLSPLCRIYIVPNKLDSTLFNITWSGGESLDQVITILHKGVLELSKTVDKKELKKLGFSLNYKDGNRDISRIIRVEDNILF